MTDKRLIEVAFPLQQTSLDSVHEKNVRHGHISTLHIWPARRPLAASRAALIATLLPDPAEPQKRKEVLERLGGKLVAKDIKKKLPSGKTEIVKTYETVGGILHWGRESGRDLDWFREEIKKAYGGRAPTVLDPFAGGGAIPLEAMRLGCEVTAGDINPVAWFILRCTLEYPKKLAGQKRRLPDFAISDRGFMEGFLKSQGLKGAALRTQLAKLIGDDAAPKQHQAFDNLQPLLEADLAWHVRAWGRWVLKEARKDLARFYPTYASFEALDGSTPKGKEEAHELVPLNVEGDADPSVLNREFSRGYLENQKKPRWVAKPTVAYLWARTVSCKNCRATIPLLKTRWLCKKDNKRVVLEMTSKADRTGVEFSIDQNAKVVGQNSAARREHDKRLGAGTMSRSGAKCPCCNTIMTMEDVRLEGRAGRLGLTMMAIVQGGLKDKEYRLPTRAEIVAAIEASDALAMSFADVPFGVPNEPTPKGGSGASRAFSVDGYGLDKWSSLFTPRQLLAVSRLVAATRRVPAATIEAGYSKEFSQAVTSYLSLAVDKTSDYGSALCSWHNTGEKMRNTFMRFALPIVWDIAEMVPTNDVGGSYLAQLDWIARSVDHLLSAFPDAPTPVITCQSATKTIPDRFDLVITDPPYYDAIPYSDLMDFFYVWLRRTTNGLVDEVDSMFSAPLGPKWDRTRNDGELIDDASRFGGDRNASKKNYEEGMARSFAAARASLNPNGRFVIVFAHKHPDAWEALVTAIVRAGFVVDGSWPIRTEMGTRARALTGAALSSSVWLVCRTRSDTARPGWDNRVLEEMHQKITQRLREFWDAGIRGPDFVWAATGPALEAYSQHPVVKKANSPGEFMTVSEFLRHVRKIVVDFVVGRVLSGDGDAEEEASGLDDVTTYYLLHRHDFGFGDAKAGACILYAVSCGLSDRELSDQYDLLSRTGGVSEVEEDDEQGESDESSEDDASSGTGSSFKLNAWNQRKATDLGLDAPRGKPIPLIDQVHRIMRLWKGGDVVKVNEYLDQRALRNNRLFHQLLQALIELAPHGSEERSLLESISNHVAARGISVQQELKIHSV